MQPSEYYKFVQNSISEEYGDFEYFGLHTIAISLIINLKMLRLLRI